MRGLRTCSFVACFLSCIGSIYAQDIRGQWSGTVVQNGPGDERSEYAAEISLDGEHGTIDYPSLGCGGVLLFVDQRGKASAYRERLTYGVDRCVDYGLVLVVQRGDALQWEWRFDVTAAGTLQGSPARRD